MLKHPAFLLSAIMFALPAPAAVLTSYQEAGCTYEGGVGKDGKPAGKGTWHCRDGRGYAGSFKNGKFDGQGVYTVAAGREVFLEPFNSDSTKFRNMALSGTFKKGLAHGRFTVSQNGETLFIMKCENGMIQEVKLPKNK
ncbi:MORN repeat-containing protein [Neisseria lactamica]|uniref:Putative periplasmic protein n=1 Tax=Neisseria lactamica (strain 020-06) TaxID=489653 RepID=E4ZE22_NEIL0|nr:MORN repeat-containing protein [Neisseria lactamica]CBN87606.1 putative periplasmic protein [Neisseria lactamica 020-06]SUA14874.1 MORN repeat protein [Neisseria lactamica]